MKVTLRNAFFLLAASLAFGGIVFLTVLHVRSAGKFHSPQILQNQTPLARVVFVTSGGGDVTVPVERAETPDARAQGLADRDALPAQQGMLFVWEGNEESDVPFTMAGMRFGLDIIFVKAAEEEIESVSYIAENLFPCPERVNCTLAYPPEPYRYVVEVNAGFAKRYGIRVGDTVHIVQ